MLFIKKQVNSEEWNACANLFCLFSRVRLKFHIIRANEELQLLANIFQRHSCKLRRKSVEAAQIQSIMYQTKLKNINLKGFSKKISF